MTKRELAIIFISAIIILGVTFIKVNPKIITNTKEVAVKSEPIQLPGEAYTITQLVPDGIAQEKLEECRKGYHDIILRVNAIQQKVKDSDEPIESDDVLFNVDDFSRTYGLCW